jgi:four helix bundle protein
MRGRDGRTGGRADGRTGGRGEIAQRGRIWYHDLDNRAYRSLMMPYERFEAWQVCHQLALEVYRITDRWPSTERYQLTAQTRRAALSAPTNIAEGASKRGPREFRRYLDIARGSLSELSYLLLFSKDRGILERETFDRIDTLRNRAGKLTWGLYASLSPTQSR